LKDFAYEHSNKKNTGFFDGKDQKEKRKKFRLRRYEFFRVRIRD